jgi:hypothetical protein
MTVTEIQKALRPFKKVTVKQVRIYIKESGIQHLGIRQRPQNYPDDSAQVILRHLGYDTKRRAA